MTPEEAGLTRKDHSVLTRVSPCILSLRITPFDDQAGIPVESGSIGPPPRHRPDGISPGNVATAMPTKPTEPFARHQSGSLPDR